MYNITLQRKGVHQHLWQLSLQLRGRLSIGRRRLCRYVENICLIEIFATFLLSARLACADVDECVENAPCKENCINTVGSYRCSCSQGFRPRVDDCIGKYGRLGRCFRSEIVVVWRGACFTYVILVRWKGVATINRSLTAKQEYFGSRNS